MIKRCTIIILLFLSSTTKGQENITVVGLQYKPIIPASYFNSSNIYQASDDFTFNLKPKYSYSIGLIVRKNLNQTFSIETGMNYINRKLCLIIENETIQLNESTIFNFRAYEVPIQSLIYIRISNQIYLNTAFGFSFNIIASDSYSEGEQDYNFNQNTIKRRRIQTALLANIGAEFRTNNKGIFYLGFSLHRPWKEIARVYPKYNDFNNEAPSSESYYIEVPGSFLTIDFRYFFPINKNLN